MPICFVCSDHELSLPPADAALRLRCGHELCSQCLAQYLLVKCREAMERVQRELSPFAAEFGGQALRQFVFAGRIRQCPKCGYGPVVNTRCSDMAAHDAQHGTGANRTTNSCPRCGFFSRNWADWHAWEVIKISSAAPCPLCMQPCCLDDDDACRFQRGLDEAEQELADLRRKFAAACTFRHLLIHLANQEGGRRPQGWNPAAIALAFHDLEGLHQALRGGPLHRLLRRRLDLRKDAEYAEYQYLRRRYRTVRFPLLSCFAGLRDAVARAFRRRRGGARWQLDVDEYEYRLWRRMELEFEDYAYEVLRARRRMTVVWQPRALHPHALRRSGRGGGYLGRSSGCLSPFLPRCLGTGCGGCLPGQEQRRRAAAATVNQEIFAECARLGASASGEGTLARACAVVGRQRLYALACLLADPGSHGRRIAQLASERPWEWRGAEDPEAANEIDHEGLRPPRRGGRPGEELRLATSEGSRQLARVIGAEDPDSFLPDLGHDFAEDPEDGFLPYIPRAFSHDFGIPISPRHWPYTVEQSLLVLQRLAGDGE